MSAVAERDDDNVTPLRPDIGLPRSEPIALEAEQSLLGAILVENNAYAVVQERLRPEYFGYKVNAEIYAAIGRVIERGEIANPISLAPYFKTELALANIEAGEYLTKLALSAVSILNVASYAEQILEAWQRRRLIAIAGNLNERAARFDLDDPVDGQIDQIAEELHATLEAGSNETVRGVRPLSEGVAEAIERVEAAYRGDTTLAGIPTGIAELNKKIGGLQPDDLVYIGGAPGQGKAQPLTAKVLTVTGWKQMGDLKIGDRLASPDGQPSVVTGIYPQGIRPTVNIHFYDGRVTRCSPDHLWKTTYNRRRQPKVLRAEKLREMLLLRTYQRRMFIPLVTGEFGSYQPALAMDPYLLGILLGDGCLRAGAKFTSNDPHIVNKVSGLLVDGYEIHSIGNEHLITRGRVGRSNSYVALIRAMGLFGVKSEGKFIPAEYMEAPREARVELIRGLLDTDGTVDPSGVISYCTVSRRLALQVRSLIWSIGGVCRLRRKRSFYRLPNGERKRCQDAFILIIRHNTPWDLVTLPRKLARISAEHQYAGHYKLRIERIEDDDPVECQCISVSHPEGLYITDDYVVTHNTSSAVTIALAAARTGRQTLFFSAELSRRDIAAMFIAALTGISVDRQRRGDLDGHDFDRVVAAQAQLSRLPIEIDDTGSIEIGTLRQRARRAKRRHGLALVVVDYVQLVRASGGRGSGEDQMAATVRRVSAGLREMAKELKIPVVATSQLTRDVDKRDDKRPVLSDLRWAAELEQDATIIGMVFRADYYLSRAEPVRKPNQTELKFQEEHANWSAALEEARGRAEIIVPKNRFGRTGTARCFFDPERSLFVDDNVEINERGNLI